MVREAFNRLVNELISTNQQKQNEVNKTYVKIRKLLDLELLMKNNEIPDEEIDKILKE